MTNIYRDCYYNIICAQKRLKIAIIILAKNNKLNLVKILFIMRKKNTDLLCKFNKSVLRMWFICSAHELYSLRQG